MSKNRRDLILARAIGGAEDGDSTARSMNFPSMPLLREIESNVDLCCDEALPIFQENSSIENSLATMSKNGQDLIIAHAIGDAEDGDSTARSMNFPSMPLLGEIEPNVDLFCNETLPFSHENSIIENSLDCDVPDFQRIIRRKATRYIEDETDSDTSEVSGRISKRRPSRSLFIEDSDDSVKDKNYVPDPSEDYDSSDDCSQSVLQMQLNEELCAVDQWGVNHNESQSNEGLNENIELAISADQGNEVHTVNDENIMPINNENDRNAIMAMPSEAILTKSGTTRKRRIFTVSLEERKKVKKELQKEKLSMKEPCGNSCRKKCTQNISVEEREELNKKFVNLDHEARGVFIKSSVLINKVTSRKNINIEPKKHKTLKYFFKIDGNKIVYVCKTYFLTTLGYNAKNDTKVLHALNKSIDDQKDKRGVYDHSNRLIDRTCLIQHIMSFNPVISHYRREHAPNKLYLPSDITIRLMHGDFIEKFSSVIVSYEVYRKVVSKDLNISFAVLGNEECELCAIFQNHNPEHTKDPQDDCGVCNRHLVHRRRYKNSRKSYKNDKLLVSECSDILIVSVDLQKVVMLPRIDSYKAAIFCPRLIAFNESFVPLGSITKDRVPYAAVWHEATSGRNVNDIVSAYRAFLVHNRDIKNFVIWADNCSSQNKNWTLFSFLVNIINSNIIESETITVKYLEPGHTFNSADSFHHQVEQSLQKKKKVYDFSDFVDCVKSSNCKQNNVKVMEVGDFYKYADYHSEHKMRLTKERVYLKDIMQVKVERGNFNLLYKNDHTDENFKILQFLQNKIIKNKEFPETSQNNEARGIKSQRKQEIVDKLCPIMPPSRRDFWINIFANDSSEEYFCSDTQDT